MVFRIIIAIGEFSTQYHRQGILHLTSTRSHLLHPGEKVLFNSIVESRKPRRRASRLLPMATPPKPKTRLLVLTTNRLICLKLRPKGGVSIKSELGLRAGDKPGKEKEKEREKEMRCILSSVEPKGETEFVVFTVSLLVSFYCGR